MKRILLISPKNRTVYNFRGDLIKDLQKKGYQVFVSIPDLTNIEKIEELNVSYRVIKLSKHGLNFFDDLNYILNLTKYIKKIKPDLILAYTVKPIVYGSISSRISGVKNFYSMVEGLGFVFISKSIKAKILNVIIRYLYKLAFKLSKKIIFLNDDDLKLFTISKITKKEKSFVVNGAGINLEKFKPLPYPEKITFFMLSRLLKSKGVMQYLYACEKIKRKYPQIKCMLLGKIENMPDAIPEKEIMKFVEKGVVELFNETENVLDFYKESSVYVLTSYREGIPRTVLEAMACARPIIVTEVPGSKETLKEGYNGFFVPLNDVDKLVEKMEWFIENKEQIQTMGKNSYDLCVEKFDVKKVNKSLLKIMQID